MRALIVSLALFSSCTPAYAQTFPVPGPGHVVWTAGGGGGGGSAAVESRCTELGANCTCSETLNGTYSYPVGSEESADFAVSPDATECLPFEMEPVGGPGKFVSVTPPVALGSVAKVMEAKSPPFAWLSAPAPKVTTKRMCLRYYMMVSNDFSGIGNLSCPAQRNKIMQATFNGGGGTVVLAQMQERSDADPCTGPGFGPYREIWLDTQISGTILSPSVRFSDCNVSTGWCRVEECVGSSNTLRTGGLKTIEAYVKPLSGPESSAIVTESMAGSSGAYWGADLYHGGGTGAVGSRFISHFMAAELDTNAGQRIGDTCEAVGGC